MIDTPAIFSSNLSLKIAFLVKLQENRKFVRET